MHGTGTYFASALDHFLRSVLAPGLATADGAPRAKTFVVFPDGGAHKRFYTMVHTRLFAGLPYDHILWIKKTRVGADITQADGFNYVDEAGAERAYAAGTFPAGAHVILADDFTQSGSTLSARRAPPSPRARCARRRRRCARGWGGSRSRWRCSRSWGRSERDDCERCRSKQARERSSSAARFIP